MCWTWTKLNNQGVYSPSGDGKMFVPSQYTLLCEWTRWDGVDEILYVKLAGLKVLKFEYWCYRFSDSKACHWVWIRFSFMLEGLETSFQVVFWFFPLQKYFFLLRRWDLCNNQVAHLSLFSAVTIILFLSSSGPISFLKYFLPLTSKENLWPMAERFLKLYQDRDLFFSKI